MTLAHFADASMFELFRAEAEDQTRVLNSGLLKLERSPGAAEHLEACMRAAHSLKGAARIIGFSAGVRVAHSIEDAIVRSRESEQALEPAQIDQLLRGSDLLRRMAALPDAELQHGGTALTAEVLAFQRALEIAPGTTRAATLAATPGTTPATTPAATTPAATPAATPAEAPAIARAAALERPSRPIVSATRAEPPQPDDRILRVSADNLDTMMRLAGEALVEARRLKQGIDLAHRLYQAALACRMRPFGDGTHGFTRMVRDISRDLNKEARLEIIGLDTPVDREILDLLEAPLGHLIRNAVDHGIEAPAARHAAGKPAEGLVRLEARHGSGQLIVSVSDDGSGVPLDALREKIVARNLASAETAARLTEAELVEFLFLPGFSMKETVTAVSGRGVGLDVVHEMVKRVRGSVRMTSTHAHGTKFQLHLPLTLSVVRTLLVEIAGEPYAIPLAQIARAARVPETAIQHISGHPHFDAGGRSIGLVDAALVVRGEAAAHAPGDRAVVILGNREHNYGLLVERFLGERELVVQKLDARLGKVQNVSAAAVMEDGSPVLILDVDDVIRTVEKLVAERRIARVSRESAAPRSTARRILVVEDSLTVRELQRKILANAGYDVEVATDGMEGWNTARARRFDLIVTDIDMPRLDGIELVQLIRKDPHLKNTPVMIVSYKDRPEDRTRGLEAGADHYLAKASFHDSALLDTVRELIGEALP
jgi:two-component system, chemotaxis family, sensor histidine kinase and response regulator WspE